MNTIALCALAVAVGYLIYRINQSENKVMAAIDDLKSVAAKLGTEMGELSASVQAVLDKLNQPNPDDAAIAEVVAALGGVAEGLDEAEAKLNAAAGV